MRWPLLLACALMVEALPRPCRAQGAPAGEASCRTCHPGAARGLALSVHVSLLSRADACASCHGDLDAHGRAMARPGLEVGPKVAPVALASCKQCHGDRVLQTAAARHDFVPKTMPPAATLPGGAVVQELQAQEQSTALRWSGLLEAGYRFVHQSGSRAGYDTDVDLDPGVVLRGFEMRGAGAEPALLHEVSLVAHDIGDPRWDAALRADRTGHFSAGASYRRDEYRYEASGDYHRVDREIGESRYDAEVWVEPDLAVFATFSRTSEDGFWLTQRIGNQNLAVQTVVDGVQSPRRYASDEGEVGLRGTTDGWHWTFAGNYLDEHTDDRWFYTRPAQANPAFPESEDFASGASLRGPGGRIALSRDTGPLVFDFTGRYVDRERKLAAAGTGAGFDIAQFTSTTVASGEGDTQTLLLDASASLELGDDARLVVDAHWRDHQERLLLLQTDTTVYPTLGTVITVPLVADQKTDQQLFDGSIALELTPHETLDVTVGVGYAHESLSVPAFTPADPGDYRSGTVHDTGFLGGLRWRPVERWTLRADVRDYGQDGVFLHELAPNRTRSANGSLGYRDEHHHGTVFVRHRWGENPVSQHRAESLVVGTTGGVSSKGLSAVGTYSFARMDSQTLTNFYFSATLTPQLVGFEGDTHTVTASLIAEVSSDVRWEFTASWSRTTGDFDVSLLDWRADLQFAVLPPHGKLGLEYRDLWYRDENGIDDWAAKLFFLYWRQTW
ncbi:MAG TPA: cytochrome c3 family protein [Planctomycetota bacterium]|nr:cytochrome c3 family protein [Planctomycetota bacterium]